MSTPTPLTASQMSNLSSILNNQSLTTSQRSAQYYQTLASYGYNYGNLAEGVVNNNTLAGQIANNFIQDYANANGITYNSTTASNIQYGLAQADLAARENAGGNDISGSTIEAYHQAVFADYGLPIQAWTGYVPYQLLGEDGWQSELGGTAGQSLVAAEIEGMANNLGDFNNPAKAIQAADWDASIQQAILNTSFFQQPLTSMFSSTSDDSPNFTATNASSADGLLGNSNLALMNYCTVENPTGSASAFMTTLGYQGIQYINNSSISNPNAGQLATATTDLSAIGSSSIQNGNVDINLNSGTSAPSSLDVLENGGDVCTVGQDTLNFSGNSLLSLTANSGVFNYGLTSSAAGFSEGIQWNSNNGQAMLDLAPTNGGSTVATSLGQINPGDALNVNGNTAGLYNANNQEMDSAQINSNGSQIDTTYDTTGGTWSNDAEFLNSTGKETEIQYNNVNNNDVYDFYNTAASGDPLAAQQFVNANGADEVSSDGFNVNYVSGDTASVMIPTTGGADVTIDPKTGTADTVDLTNSGITSTVDGITFSDTLANTAANIDTSGDVTLATSVSGVGISDLTLGATGTDTFAVGSDDLSFTPNDLKSFSTSNGAFDFNVAPAASGYSEVVAWNPANGQATLDLTASNGSTIATALGQINPGDVLKDTGSTISDDTSSGTVINSDVVSSNGSQVDTAYDTTGGTWSNDVYDYNSTGALTEAQYNNTNNNNVYDFYNTAASGDPLAAQQFVNANGADEVSSDGFNINYVSGDTASLTVPTTGGADVTIDPKTGAADTVDLTSSGITSTVDGITLTDTQANTAANIDSTGDVTLATSVSGVGTSDLTLGANGTDTFAVGSDDLSFAANDLKSYSYASSAFDFNVAPAASGYSEVVAWNPTNGQATLDLTASNGTTIATALGQINPGDVLKDTGSTIADDTSSGTVINSDTVASNGSQVDTAYDTTGGTWSNTVTDTNSTGTITEVEYNNVNNSDVYDFYNTAASGDPLAAQQFLNANGTGEVTADGYAVNYVSGDAPSGVSIGSNGTAAVTIPNSGSTTDTVDLSSGGLTTVVDGSTLVDDVSGSSAAVSSTGSIVLSSGGTTLTESSNGATDTFVDGSDAITVSASSVNSVAYSGGAYDFNLNSAASGYSESMDWNPTTGKAVLDLTNTSTGTTFATSLGYINPGDDLNVTSSALTNDNSSGQAMYTTDVLSNGSQNDISYNLSGGSALDTVLTYSGTGAETEAAFNNTNGSAVDDFYNSSGAQVTQEILNSNDSGTVSWDGSGTTTSVSFTDTSGLVVSASATQDSLGVSGSGTVTAASGTDVTETVGNGSNVTFNGSGSTINGGSSDTIAVNGNDTVNTSNDTVNVSNSDSDTINGSGNTVNLGTGDTVSASNDTVRVGSSSADTVNGNGDNVGANSGANGDTLYVNGSSDTVGLNGGSSTTVTGSSDTVNASSDTVSLGNNSTAAINGSGDTLNLGASDAVSASNDHINIGSSVQDTVNGSSDSISAGSHDTIDVSGQSDSVSASSSSVDFSGSTSGDSVGGSGDSSDLGGGTGGGGGGGGGTGGGSGGGSGSGSGGFSGNKVKVSATLGASTGTIAKFGFAAQLGAKHLQTAFNEVNQAVSTNVQSAVLNGDKWAAGTVTWSFTAPSGASAAADSAYEATAQQAFAAWGLATGLQFQEVSKSSSTDIQIGWSNLDPTDTGLIAFTDYKASKGQFLAGDSITLENPTEDALTAGSNGQLTYAGTQATLLQVIEHEVGHTLGFADNNNASSIMNYYLGGSNQTLSSQDVGAAETLYGHNVGSSSSQVMINGQWQQLAQAMATSNGQTGMALYEGGQFVPLQQQPTPLAAGHA